MSNYFTRTLCSIILATGFILGGCSSLNKDEDNLRPMAKSLEIKTETSLTKTSYEPVVRVPTNTKKSDLYSIKDNLLDYRISLSPKSNYVPRDEQLITRSQAREKLWETLGLDKYMIPNKINFYNSLGINVKLHWGFIGIDDSLFMNKDKPWYQIFDTINMDLSVVLVRPARIQELNRQYRGKDKATDVLSFAYGQDSGEVVICPAKAEKELEWILIHGILHILGFDHEKTVKER